MRYLLIFLLAISAFAKEDELAEIIATSKARKEALKTFREKVSLGDLCRPRDYVCFQDALSKIPGIHPEDLIAARSLLEPFYTRSVNDKLVPCGPNCQHTLRAYNVWMFIQFLLNYNTRHGTIYNFKDSTTVRITRIRAYMDLSAYGNMQKHLKYIKSEFQKIDFSKVTVDFLRKKGQFETKIRDIDLGLPFSRSVLCHIHSGSLIYDEIINRKATRADEKYSAWLKNFDSKARLVCEDSTPIEYRGMDLSTRQYYDRQTINKLNAIDCAVDDYACLRKAFRGMPIRYAKDVQRVDDYISERYLKNIANNCDETCKVKNFLRSTQTLITFLSNFDRQKLGSTMDWKKYPEAKYQTLSEDVWIFITLQYRLRFVLETLGSLDPAKVEDPGLRSELKSISKDVSDYMSGKMLKDSVICTMEPWNANYDKYMTPFKVPKRNKKFEQDFLLFKETVCK